jgi:hypothetical protein
MTLDATIEAPWFDDSRNTNVGWASDFFARIAVDSIVPLAFYTDSDAWTTFMDRTVWNAAPVPALYWNNPVGSASPFLPNAFGIWTTSSKILHAYDGSYTMCDSQVYLVKDFT